MKQIINNQGGYIALVTVLIILGVGVAVAVTVSMNAINEMQMGFSSAQAEQAFVIADSCAEEGILRLKRDETPPASLSFTDGSCTIEVDDLGGDSRRLKVTGTVSNYNSLIETEITIGDDFAVISWQEVGEFSS